MPKITLQMGQICTVKDVLGLLVARLNEEIQKFVHCLNVRCKVED